jgi:oligoribonuclease (3'-5' exoribonuclease)
VLEIYAFPVDVLHFGAASPQVGDPGAPFHTIFQFSRDELMSLCSDEVLKMHLSSGLLHADGCYTDQPLVGRESTNAHRWRRFWFYCQSVMPTSGVLHLAGLSVHFDLGFLRNAPRNGSAFPFSHRVLDITSLKLLWPSVYRRHSQEAKSHRAKEDTMEAYETLVKGLKQDTINGPVAGC